MQLSQKRCPHSVCRGVQSTSLQASQQYLGSGVMTKRSLKPPCRGKKPGSGLDRWAMEDIARDGGRCCRAICCSTLRPADMTWRETNRLGSNSTPMTCTWENWNAECLSYIKSLQKYENRFTTTYPNRQKIKVCCHLWHIKFLSCPDWSCQEFCIVWETLLKLKRNRLLSDWVQTPLSNTNLWPPRCHCSRTQVLLSV